MLTTLKTEHTWVNWEHIEGLLKDVDLSTQQVFNTFLQSLYGQDESSTVTKKRGRGSKSITSDMTFPQFQSFSKKLLGQHKVGDKSDIFLEAAECAWAAEQLRKVLKIPGRKGNRFQPSTKQLQRLTQLFGSYWSDLGPLKRHSFLAKQMMFADVEEKIYQDQMDRARSLWNDINTHGLTGIFLMDGHGTLNWCLQQAALEQSHDMSKLWVQVIDYDELVNDWHKVFLAKGTACILNNLFHPNILKRLSDQSYLDKNCVYLNFCGLGSTRSVLHQHLTQNYNSRRGELTWVKNIPREMEMQFMNLDKALWPSEEDFVETADVEKDHIQKSLVETLREGIDFPADNEDIRDMFHTLLLAIPLECFSAALQTELWIKSLFSAGKRFVIHVSYSWNRSKGEAKEHLHEYLLANNGSLVTKRPDFFTLRLINKNVTGDELTETPIEAIEPMDLEPKPCLEQEEQHEEQAEETAKSSRKLQKRHSEEELDLDELQRNLELNLDRSDEVEAIGEGQKEQEEPHDEVCFCCRLEGEVIMCDCCLHVFHAGCIGLNQPPSGFWTCEDAGFDCYKVDQFFHHVSVDASAWEEGFCTLDTLCFKDKKDNLVVQMPWGSSFKYPRDKVYIPAAAEPTREWTLGEYVEIQDEDEPHKWWGAKIIRKSKTTGKWKISWPGYIDQPLIEPERIRSAKLAPLTLQ